MPETTTITQDALGKTSLKQSLEFKIPGLAVGRGPDEVVSSVTNNGRAWRGKAQLSYGEEYVSTADMRAHAGSSPNRSASPIRLMNKNTWLHTCM